MNKINMSQRLNARMQFKSLLMLTLLAGSASAQQSPVPTIAFEVPCVDSVPALDAASTTAFVNADVESVRSSWTLRQHVTWFLGLKPRQVMSSAVEPYAPGVPPIDVASNVDELESVPASQPTDEPTILLVQHTEPVAQPVAPAITAPVEAAVAAPASSDSVRAESSRVAAPHSLNLRPVVSGPAPALPLEQLTDGSLLQVDLSGVDVTNLNPPTPPAESLIEGLGFTLPYSFSMRDSDTASLAASPSHSKPVSIHEGFAPRVSTANQAAQLTGEAQEFPAGQSSSSGPRASHFSLSDKSNAPNSGAVMNRLSDKETVQIKLGDRDEHPRPAAESKPVETSFTDKSPVFNSLPVEVSGDGDRTSRSGKPVVLTPPNRLAQATPLALPLLNAAPKVQSGGVQEVPRVAAPAAAQIKSPGQSRPDTSEKTGNDKLASASTVAEKASESLIDGLVTPPGSSTAADLVAPPEESRAKPTPSNSRDKPARDKPVRVDSVAKAATPKAEKMTLSDFNPLVMKRPVVKAASVALPEPADGESMVVPLSHEADEASQQIAEYAKMAAKMQQAVKQKFPNIRVKITCNEDGLIVEGNLANNVEASKVLSFVRKSSLCPVADRVNTIQ